MQTERRADSHRLTPSGKLGEVGGMDSGWVHRIGGSQAARAWRRSGWKVDGEQRVVAEVPSGTAEIHDGRDPERPAVVGRADARARKDHGAGVGPSGEHHAIRFDGGSVEETDPRRTRSRGLDLRYDRPTITRSEVARPVSGPFTASPFRATPLCGVPSLSGIFKLQHPEYPYLPVSSLQGDTRRPRERRHPAGPSRRSRRRLVVPKMVITHSVVDVERWLEGKAERAALIGSHATNVTDYVAADGSNNIAITADVHDMPGAQAMIASPSPETAAAMERHGVTPPITVYIEK